MIGGPDAIFFLISRPYRLRDFLKIKSIKKTQKIARVAITGARAIFLLILRPYTLGDLLKIKSINSQKIVPVVIEGPGAIF